MGHIDPTKDVFAQFRDNDRPGPIHMLNLVRLREEAAYPDGRKASGAEAYAAYGRESGPVFERLGKSKEFELHGSTRLVIFTPFRRRRYWRIEKYGPSTRQRDVAQLQPPPQVA